MTSSRSDMAYGSRNRRKSWGQFQRFLFWDCREVVQPSYWESMALEHVDTAKKVRRTARTVRPGSSSSSDAWGDVISWLWQDSDAREARRRDRDRGRAPEGEGEWAACWSASTLVGKVLHRKEHAAANLWMFQKFGNMVWRIGTEFYWRQAATECQLTRCTMRTTRFCLRSRRIL